MTDSQYTESQPQAQEEACPHCGGCGRVWWTQTEYVEHPDCGIVCIGSEYEAECPFCAGTGYAEAQNG